MTPTRQGDVVLIHYPYTDLQSAKKRPALVVSSSQYNQHSKDCVVVPITSNVNRAPSRYEILMGEQEQVLAGLAKTSLIKAGVLFTVEQTMLLRLIGRVSGTLVKRTLETIIQVLTESET